MKISVIVPVYNTEKYVLECLKSLDNQTFNSKDFEVIIIDDGSTDKSLKIIKDNMKDNYRLISRENKGISVTRNEGIKLSQGKYIMFLDSDDYLDKNTLKEMYEVISKTKSDLVIGKINAFDSRKKYGYYFDKVIKDNKTFYFNDNKKIIKTISVCSKLYKKSIIKNIKFIPNLKHEDNYFTVNLYLKNIKITTINKYFYYRRYREGEYTSIMQNLNIETFKDLIANYKYVWNYNQIDSYVFKFSFRSMINYLIKNVENKKQGLKLLINYLKEININYLTYLYYYFYLIIYYNLANLLYRKELYEK